MIIAPGVCTPQNQLCMTAYTLVPTSIRVRVKVNQPVLLAEEVEPVLYAASLCGHIAVHPI